MRLLRETLLSVVCLALAGTAARAETKVVLKGVHLCCPACARAATTIVAGVDGAKAVCDVRKKVVTITAADEQTAQKALDALAAGGFHGETGDKDLKIKDDSAVRAGKVKTLTVEGAHNCCGMCCRAIKTTLKKVDGVTGDTAKPKVNSFEVTGDFDAAAVVQALEAAGFHVKVKN
jgi:copper chaperone CopZ